MATWWVNQGQSYKQERDAGMLWAPSMTRDGRSTRKYWTALADVTPGDRVVHYAKGNIVAVSTIIAAAVPAPRPVELPDDLWEADGLLVETGYQELVPPVRLEEVPVAERLSEPAGGPFEKSGAVKMGYLFPLSESLVESVLRLCEPLLRDRQSPANLPIPPEAQDGGLGLLRRLVGVELTTPSGRSHNTVIGFDGDQVIVATAQSPQGQPVPVSEVSAALAALRVHRSLRLTPAEVGYRSTFVGSVLLTLPGTTTDGKNPPTITLGADPDAEPSGYEVPFGGELDRRRTVISRGEQSQLRRALFGTATHRHCALCGELLPVRYLVAAHIKARAVCSDAERRDFAHVAMPACLFGCDALFEFGAITVDTDGLIIAAAGLPAGLLPPVQRLVGRRCLSHSPGSSDYFRWHQMTVFQGRGQQPLPTL